MYREDNLLIKSALFLLPIALLGMTPRLWLVSAGIVLFYFSIIIISFRPLMINRLALCYCLILVIFLSIVMQLETIGNYGIQKGLYFILIIIPASLIISSLLEENRNIRYVLWGFITLGTVISLVSFFVTSYPLGDLRYQWQGNICAVSATILMQFWLIKKKVISLPLVLISSAGVIVSASKQSLVVLAFGVLLSLFSQFVSMFKAREQQSKVIASILIMILMFASGVFILTQVEIEIFSSSLSRVNYAISERYTGGRTELFALAWEVFSENPLLGAGIGQYETFNLEYQYPHNIILEILSELGLIGLIAFLLPLLIAVFSVLRLWLLTDNQALRHSLLLFLCFFIIANISGDLTSIRPMWIFGIVMLTYSANINAIRKNP